MPAPVTLFTVKIASPRDVEIEASLACAVVQDWNAAHALSEKMVLLPLVEGDSAAPCDVLIAFLHAAPGTPMETGTIEREIDGHLARKKPAFIYFSEARVALARAGDRTEQEFKTRYAGQAVIDSFNDEKEFRAKFAQQLESTVRSHSSFHSGNGEGASPSLPLAEPLPDVPRPAPAGVSDLAQKLLVTACEDPEAYIGRHRDGDTLKLQANGEQLVEPGDAVLAAKWEAAFQELLGGGYIRDAGCHGRLFQISARGFDYLLRELGKAPVGYIAELGSV
jgi:hypothetical protein